VVLAPPPCDVVFTLLRGSGLLPPNLSVVMSLLLPSTLAIKLAGSFVSILFGLPATLPVLRGPVDQRSQEQQRPDDLHQGQQGHGRYGIEHVLSA
jgi:hypothetical protein